MRLTFDINSIEDYETFLRVKALPTYKVRGRSVEFPDEYAQQVSGKKLRAAKSTEVYTPAPFLFDYQAASAKLCIRKRKFALFMRCGLGKTFCAAEFARHAAKVLPRNKCVLIVSPLMVIRQTLSEVAKYYGDSLAIEHIQGGDHLRKFLAGESSSRIGIVNYDVLDESIPQGQLGALILDESSMLKSMYGKWGTECIRLGRGLEWKLALTGTPAPNDRIEYANHAVFLDHYPTVNSFLARFFVNRGETQNRWELKPHALRAFYKALSHWCIFLNSPSTYGWRDNADTLPPVIVSVEDVALTGQQMEAAQDMTGTLFGSNAGGIGSRAKLSQLAKGSHNGEKIDSNKVEYIKRLVASWPEESTIIWCHHNDEQDAMEKAFGSQAMSIKGATPQNKREQIVEDFKSGKCRILISKPRVLGLGLNLQIATRMIFNGLLDSYEEFHQAVSRSNRVGSTRPLNVHIPITSIERPMVESVIAKANRVDADTIEQETLFKEIANEYLAAA